MDEREKAAWLKPALIVLTRGHPEEAVLVNCKTAPGTPAGGPVADDGGCLSPFCDTCTSLVAS